MQEQDAPIASGIQLQAVDGRRVGACEREAIDAGPVVFPAVLHTDKHAQRKNKEEENERKERILEHRDRESCGHQKRNQEHKPQTNKKSRGKKKTATVRVGAVMVWLRVPQTASRSSKNKNIIPTRCS